MNKTLQNDPELDELIDLEEEIPDQKREIGKKKSKISPQILQIIKDM